ncbi:DUF2382 domain-containing protein [Chamaesiphon sp. VAR_48_metabat_135_sub]|uniref:DUF2382 domain-containing protein n=1 Tax=Chamaesiphon sp. VAR_48_metabat_135_sub TaxID=2964699 RepID=UPI00286C728A|nr:DUF2382 domain-containing protein [Chamaesiphon sp. VAR_48_metabat_135_sub]
MISKELEYSERASAPQGGRDSDVVYHTKVDSTSNIVTQKSFSLLEERLKIELTQHKIGEIVIRKEIETQLVSVQVPVRREKLIIEQVSPAYKLLAEIDLGETSNSSGATIKPISENGMSANSDKKSSTIEVDSLPKNLERRMTPPTVYGSTDSLKAASQLLSAIASLPRHDCGTVQIEIALKDSKHQASYQALVDRYCQA